MHSLAVARVRYRVDVGRAARGEHRRWLEWAAVMASGVGLFGPEEGLSPALKSAPVPVTVVAPATVWLFGRTGESGLGSVCGRPVAD